MNTPRRFPLLFLLLPLAFTAAAALAVDLDSAIDHARNGLEQQEQIRTDFRRLLADLDSTIDQYDRNGLHGADEKALKKIRAIISNISETDMAKIVGLLRQAGSAASPADALRKVSAAYSAQKGAIAQIKVILDESAREQEAQALSDQAAELAGRQAANLQAGIETARWSLARAGKKDDAEVAAAFEVQTAEQQAISGDMARLRVAIDAFAKNPANQALAERFKKGSADAASVAPLIDSAATLLGDRKLFEAVSGEKPARDGLRQLARTLAPPLDKADALVAALEKLEKIIAQQKGLISASDKAMVPGIDEWLAAVLKNARGGEYSALKKVGLLDLPAGQLVQSDVVKTHYAAYVRHAQEDLPDLENEQGDLLNQSDALSQDINPIAPPASASLASSMPPMQTARGSLIDRQAPEASHSQNEALVWLLKTKAMLEEELAKQKTDSTDTDPGTLANNSPTGGGNPAANTPAVGTTPATAGNSPDGNAPTGTAPDGNTPPANTPPNGTGPTAGVPPSGTSPTGTSPTGTPPDGTSPTTGTAPDGTSPTAGTAPNGTSPATGTPPNGTSPAPGTAPDGTPPNGNSPTAGNTPGSPSPADGTPPNGNSPGAPAPGTSPAGGPPMAGNFPSGNTPAPGSIPGSTPGSAPGVSPGAPAPGTGNGPGVGDGGGAASTTAGRPLISQAAIHSLPPRWRPAIQQANREKYPTQYAAKIEQYMRNLADESTTAP